MSKSYITAIGTAVPPYRMSQSSTREFMVNILRLDEAEARKLRVLYRLSAIQYRYTVLEDYTREENFSFFPNDPKLHTFPTTAQRMRIYEENAIKVALEAIKDAGRSVDLPLQQITHLITVSCTGMYAPGLDLELIEQLGLNFSTQRVSINFMGCYAAFNALKVADSICRSDPMAKVLIADVELCTLHFQDSALDDDLIANSLFADGAAAVLVEAQPRATGISLSMDAFHCGLAPQGRKEMAWYIKDQGFEMRLSGYVPDILQGSVRPLLAELLAKLHLSLDEVKWLALHPGGRRILEAIEEVLQIPKEKNRASYEILKNYGNMSSATVLFVLKYLLENENLQKGQKILSMAFGPGLTLESALLGVCK